MSRGKEVKFVELPMNKIKLGRNSRMSMSEEDLSGLMQSINSTGLLEPIGVVETKDGKSYEIAYGNRRFMAFSKLGLHSIPCVVHKRYKDNDVDVKNLAENVQRRNISLAEIGRYATILEQEGLSIKELAVRLGAPINYITACISAYREVPKEFREDLAVSVPGKTAEVGKIAIGTAQKILNATKQLGMSRAEASILYRAAKSDSRFTPENIHSYVAAIKRKNKDPIGSVRPVKSMTFRMIMAESEYDSLLHKYVENGPFNSFTALVKAVCRGQKQVVINFID